jgi:hypothetical protein
LVGGEFLDALPVQPALERTQDGHAAEGHIGNRSPVGSATGV